MQKLTQANCWIPDAAALDRIVKAVGHHYWSNLDRDRLVEDLLNACSKWRLFTALDSDKGASERKKSFGSIADAGMKFRERLFDESGQKGTLKFKSRTLHPAAEQIASTLLGVSDFSDFYAFLDVLDRVIQAAEIGVRDNSNRGWVKLRRAPKKWFAGEILPDIYERNFGRRAGISTRGPFVKFAVAVMKEMGIFIEAETAAGALKDVRAGRGERKARSTTLPRPTGW